MIQESSFFLVFVQIKIENDKNLIKFHKFYSLEIKRKHFQSFIQRESDKRVNDGNLSCVDFVVV